MTASAQDTWNVSFFIIVLLVSFISQHLCSRYHTASFAANGDSFSSTAVMKDYTFCNPSQEQHVWWLAAAAGCLQPSTTPPQQQQKHRLDSRTNTIYTHHSM
jgi:hypothetical protein